MASKNQTDSGKAEDLLQPTVGQETNKKSLTLKQSDSGKAEASIQPTVTSTESSKKRLGAARSVAAMNRVVIRKAAGKKFKVRWNYLGVPIGHTRHTLQSYIGMVARTLIPIDVSNWPNVETDLKDKLWDDIQDTFQIPPESKDMVLKSAGTKWRQFKAALTTKHVLPYIGNKKKLRKPPKQYAFVGREAWKKFVAERTSEQWQSLHEEQSKRVLKRKYPHRLSRKGYIGLQEEAIKAGKLEKGEIPDRAKMWKMARIPKDKMIDEDLAKVNEKIDSFLEKKNKGEFVPSGSEDVLTMALETPEHAGRVRGVGSFVTPKLFFNLPKEKRIRITKSEMLARDRQRDEEMMKFKLEIENLKAMIKDSNGVSSPIISEKASCQPNDHLAQEANNIKLSVDEEDYIAVIPNPNEKKGPVELAEGNIGNIVAFGTIFDENPELNTSIHGMPMPPGCVRVSVDGIIQPDADLPCPIRDRIEKVHQALGSFVAWPRDLIVFSPVVAKKKREHPKTDLQKVHTMFNEMQINRNVPARYRLLYKHTTFMAEAGTSIPMPCDVRVFGAEKIIYILPENLIALLEFEMIGQGVISAYMAYLHTVLEEADNLETFGFCDPAATFTLNKDFEAYMVNRFKEGKADRMFMLPHNTYKHWILVIIWVDEIFILNPLSHSTNYPELEKSLSSAVKEFKAQTGRGNKPPKFKYMNGCPKQPGGMECGYVVMRYMKEIIEDSELSFMKKWMTKSRKCYTRQELDVVRFETLDFIEARMY